MMQSKRPCIFHLWRLRRNGHSLFITGGWLWINLCLFLRTESKYKNKLTTEFCFYLHKILDSVILKNTQIKVCFLTFYYIKYIASEYLLIHIKRGWILSPLQTKSLKSCPSLRTLTYSWVSLYMRTTIHQKYINGCIIKNYLRHSLPFYIRPYQIFCSTVIGSVSGFASCSNVVPKNNQIINRIIAITTPKTSSTFVFFRLMSILQYWFED